MEEIYVTIFEGRCENCPEGLHVLSVEREKVISALAGHFVKVATDPLHRNPRLILSPVTLTILERS